MMNFGNWAYGEWGIAALLALLIGGAVAWVVAEWRERLTEADATASGAGADLSWGDTLDDIRRADTQRAARISAATAARAAGTDTGPIAAADLRTRILLDDIEIALSAGLTAVTERAYLQIHGLRRG